MKTVRSKYEGALPVTEPELRRKKQARSAKATVKRWITQGIIEREALITYLQRLSPGPQIVDVNPQRKQEAHRADKGNYEHS